MRLIGTFFGRDGKAAVIGMKSRTKFVAYVVRGKDAARKVVAETADDDGNAWTALSLVDRSSLPATDATETSVLTGGAAEHIHAALSTVGAMERESMEIDPVDRDAALSSLFVTFSDRGGRRNGILAYGDPERTSHVFAFASKRGARRHLNQQMLWLDAARSAAIRAGVNQSDLDERSVASATEPPADAHIVGELAARIRTGIYLLEKHRGS